MYVRYEPRGFVGLLLGHSLGRGTKTLRPFIQYLRLPHPLSPDVDLAMKFQGAASLTGGSCSRHPSLPAWRSPSAGYGEGPALAAPPWSFRKAMEPPRNPKP